MPPPAFDALDALLHAAEPAHRRQALELLRALDDPELWRHALVQFEDAQTHTGQQLRLALYRSAPPALCTFRAAWARINAEGAEDLWFLAGSRPLYRLHLRFAHLETLAALPVLPELTHLTLEHPQALTDLDGLAARCPRLEMLRLERCPRLRSLRGLDGCAHLHSLTLLNLPALTDDTALQYCAVLRELVARHVSRAPILRENSRHPALCALTIDHCPEVKDIQALRRSPRLRQVHLRAAAVEDISPLTAATALRGLSLCELPLDSLVPLKALPGTLKLRLDLRQSMLRDLDGLQPFSLRSLDLRRAPRLESLHGLEGMTSLEALDLRHCRVPDLRVLPSLTGLRRLCLPSQLSARSPEALGLQHLTALEYLAAHRWQLESLRGLAPLKNLQILRLSACPNLHTGWSALVALPRLRALSLAGCPRVRFLGATWRGERLRERLRLLLNRQHDPRFDLWIQDPRELQGISRAQRQAAQTAILSRLTTARVPRLSDADALTTLTLRACGLGTLDGLQQFPALEVLHFLRSSTHDAAPLDQCLRLHTLSIHGGWILAEGPLPALAALQTLEVHGASFTGQQHPLPSLTRLVWMTSLSSLRQLRGSPRLTTLETAPEHLQNLTELVQQTRLTTLVLRSSRSQSGTTALPPMPTLERLVLGPRIAAFWRSAPSPLSSFPALQRLDTRESRLPPEAQGLWESREAIEDIWPRLFQ